MEKQNEIIFDDIQKQIIECDDDIIQVIAGAGGGKSTVIAGKIVHLVNDLLIDPEDILLLSFTNKSVNDLRAKINEMTDVKFHIKTFHSEGLNIYSLETGQKKDTNCLDKVDTCINEAINEIVLKDRKLAKKMITLLSSYLYAPPLFENKADFLSFLMTKEYETLKNCLKDFKDTEIKTLRKNYITICEEKVKSHEETDIANFLYLNCIDYEYELPYITSFALSNNAYTPDFRISQGDKIIYVEHYGISEDGKASQMSEETREKYIRHIKDKKEHHRQNNTVLIENYSVYNDGRHYKEHLEEDLKSYGIVFRERDEEELIQKLVKHKSNSYIKELVKLIKNFMSRFIEKGYTDEDFPKLKNTENPRDQLFLDIFEICYNYYENYLKEKCALDFSHMITNAKNILSIDNEQLKTRKYKYIIIDEYQDISKSRMEFVKSLLQYSGAKLMVVGDDWQTIYSFSGSDIKYFTEFDKLFSNPTKFILNKTYRNSQELINIAGNFIMKNNAQLKKQLISDKHCDKPVVVYPYETKKYTEIEYKNRETYAIAVELEKIIERINREQGPDTSILILGRYNKELNDLEDSGLFKTKQKDNTKYLKSDKYPDQKITLSTVHKSKGLGFDNVILINCKDDIYGFPS